MSDQRTAKTSGAGFAFAAQMALDPRWVIWVGGGYGAFLFAGSEAEAEEVRCNTASWEHAIAKKRPASYQDIDLPSICLNHRGFLNQYRYANCHCGGCHD